MAFVTRDLYSPSASKTSRPARPRSSKDATTSPAQYDDQLQSPFFTLLPSEIRIQILTMLLYEGSPSQHIVHYHEAGGRFDGFIRLPCRASRLPASSTWVSRHASEARNLARSPWRDGHERCAGNLQRHMIRRRERHRAEEAAAAVLAATAPPHTTPKVSERPSKQSLPLSSQTWSFSPLSDAAQDPSPGGSGAGPRHDDSSLHTLSSALLSARLDRLGQASTDEDSLQSPVALLLTCRRLHDETAEILYSSMTFISLKPLRRFLRQVTSRDYLDRIRRISLQWDATVRTTPVLAHAFEDWDPACQRLASLSGLTTLDVKVFACERTPTQTRDALLGPLDQVRINARVNAQVVRDCRDPHATKEFVSIRIGDEQLPIRVCRVSSMSL